jgi:hypothetical protein
MRNNTVSGDGDSQELFRCPLEADQKVKYNAKENKSGEGDWDIHERERNGLNKRMVHCSLVVS